MWWKKLVRDEDCGGKSLLWWFEVVEKVCCGGGNGDDGRGLREERGKEN